jgi:hypothetical protein
VEDRHSPIRLRSRLSNDVHTLRNDPFVRCIEVVDLKEENDPPTSLVPENRQLLWTICTAGVLA